MASLEIEIEEFSSEVCRGKGTTVIWNLTCCQDSEKEEEEELSSFLHSHASCFVNLPQGEEGPTTRLRFYFQETTLTRSEPNLGPNCQKAHSINFATTWLSLWVEKVSNETGEAVQYEIKVDLLDEKGVAVGDPYSVSARRTLWRSESEPDPGALPTRKGVVKEDFIRLKETAENTFTGSSTTEKFPRPEKLRLKLSINPFYIHGGGSSGPTLKVEGDGEVRPSQSLASSSNEIIFLEMRDGTILAAPKSLLAKESPVLRARIRKDLKGEVQLSEVDAKPMVAVLHWMYTGELREEKNTGASLEEVRDAAVKFELNELTKLLEKKQEKKTKSPVKKDGLRIYLNHPL